MAMMTYKFKFYQCKKLKYLVEYLLICSGIYNHFIALNRRFYKLFHKQPSLKMLSRHLTKLLRMRRYKHWCVINSHVRQEMAYQRIIKAYNLFFRMLKRGRKCSPPKHKRAKSFTLKTTGYRIEGDRISIGNLITGDVKTYRFYKSRDMVGKIKTITIKQDAVGDWWLFVVVDKPFEPKIHDRPGNTVGVDFGLSIFLTLSNGDKISAPQFFELARKYIAKLSKALSSKKKGSHNRQKARKVLARAYRRIEWKREDFQWKLALELARLYEVVCCEDLDLAKLKERFGRKISDLAFYSFLKKLEWQLFKYNGLLVKIDRYYPSSQICSSCGCRKKDLQLGDREWTCSQCGSVHDRDANAAINIQRVGMSTLAGETVSRSSFTQVLSMAESHVL
jgi:putative transposase